MIDQTANPTVMILTLVFGGYFIIWAVPTIIIIVLLSLGDSKRIGFLDRQFSRNVAKLHSNSTWMLPHEIIARFTLYSVQYPFLKRATSNSLKLSFFMWGNFLGFWSFFLLCLILFIKSL